MSPAVDTEGALPDCRRLLVRLYTWVMIPEKMKRMACRFFLSGARNTHEKRGEENTPQSGIL